jgi:hypothetical protein
MRVMFLMVGALTLLPSACIAPSVVAREDRAVDLGAAEVDWRSATEADLPGTFVSTELSGPLATVLRKVVYLFEAEGTYTGAGLIDDVPPRFEVISGRWRIDGDGLRLDGGAPATLEVAEDGSLRLSGEEGRVVLRREASR